MLFGSGIDRYGCLVDAAELSGVIERRGSWYFKDDVKIAQGRLGAIEVLRAAGEPMLLELQSKVRAAMLSKQALLLDSTSLAVAPTDDDLLSGGGYDDSSLPEAAGDIF